MIKFEYRMHQKRFGKPQLQTLESMEGLNGFRSIFGYDEDAAAQIESQGGTYNLGAQKLYLDHLILDFDDNPEAYAAALEVLAENGWGFTAYHTGNRGYHVHIPCKPLHRVGLNHQCKRLVAKVFPGADTSIYKASGVVRVPGSIHAKTGRRMAFSASREGDLMDLDQITPKAEWVPDLPSLEEANLDRIRYTLTGLLFSPAQEGDRNNTLFRMARLSKLLGHSFEDTLAALLTWNNTYCRPPVRPHEINATIKSAYRRVD